MRPGGRVPTQRAALGVLFIFLSAGFAGIAWSAVRADAGARSWVVGTAAAALALWLASLAVRALRPR